MSTIVFFRQARIDGGIHTGVDVNGTGWEFYDAGSDEHDPALVWYVDLRRKGTTCPIVRRARVNGCWKIRRW